MLDPRGLTVPVDHLDGVHADKVVLSYRSQQLGADRTPMITMLRPHLLVLLLFCPVGPHIAAIDARQHHGAPDQNHVDRLLPVPEALLLATYDPEQQRLSQTGSG